jgi:large subunit ribosomal protein L4
MIVKALATALSVKANEKKIRVITGLEKIEGKTKEMAQVFKKVLAQEKFERAKPQFLLVLPEKKENIFRAGSNLANLKIDLAQNLNTYQVLQADFILFTREAIKKLEERLKQK